MKAQTLPIVASLFSTALAASHSIDVGENGLVFSPNSTTAAVGDTVTFHFYPHSHGVARSSYGSPCAAINDGFNSGFVTIASGESPTTFTITINDTQPIWYYCPRSDHCQAGMVGVINPPSSSDQTVGKFIIAASSAGTSTVPDSVYGGVLAANGASGGAAAGGSSMMASSMMASSSHASSSAGSSSTRAMSGSSTATGSASRTSGAATATSSIAVSTGAASSLESMGLVNIGLGLLFGGWHLV